jgi:8-oxo-dGTP diphosphatase
VPIEPRLRPAVRVVLVDPDERVLTVRWRLPDGRGVWGLPGGGIEPGESREDAVRRELHEEVGLELPAERVGSCVAHLVHVHPIGEPYDGQEEWYYLVRVPAFEPRGALDDEALAAEGIVEIRWQSIAELRTIPAVGPVVLRAGTADFAERLVRDGHPERPEELAV